MRAGCDVWLTVKAGWVSWRGMFMREVWKEEVRVLEEKVPEVRNLC